ncbi:MAG TPA: efflux RND transporter periplasmic adaptor subunit [Thermoanaerobaculia bacterium]|nr:efflux RND transporter periplasmic adaptor subunit [Thermoanaerobaculia bacterium]
MRRAAASLGAALALLACSHEPQAPLVRDRVQAPTMVVQPQPVAATRTFAGTVRATNVSPLAAKVLGNVLRVHVREGDRVRAGQLLVEIDAREAIAGTNAAASALAAAETNAALAEATFRRYDALRERGSVSLQEFDVVKARRDAAAAEVERARAVRIQARVQFDDASVRAPFDGIVSARFVDPGVQAAPGMPLLTIEDARAYRVEALLPEDLHVREGDVVQLDDDSDARVLRVQPGVDAATRSSLVQIEWPGGAANGNRSTRSGAYVRVTVRGGRRNAIRIPSRAIVPRGALTTIFVVGSDGVARMRIITVGEEGEVLSGLAANERIVTDPAGVRDGVKVS